jgi:hypothetical protein
MRFNKVAATLLAFLVGQSLLAVDIPSEWVFGTRSDEASIEYAFAMTNTTGAGVSVSTVVSCECLTITPSSLTLAPGKRMQFRVTFNPKGKRGAVSNAILFSLKGGEVADRMLTVRGTITSKAPAATSEVCVRCAVLEEEFQKAVAVSSHRTQIDVRYFYSGDCVSCTRFIDSEVPRLEGKLGIRISMDLRDIRAEAHVNEIVETLAKKGMPLVAFPIIVIDDTVLQGEKEIRDRFESALRSNAGSRPK